MNKTALTLVLIFFCSFLSAQVTYRDIASVKLNAHRQIKIKLPKNYDASSDVKHPLIIVFDGDYLFEPVIGQVDFQTYFDDMPGSIVVGVVQGEERYFDGYVDPVSGLPTESGLHFYNFIETELLPYLDANYKTSKFRVAVGHDLMGNFINSFLFKDVQAFQAYVAISPDFKGAVDTQLPARLAYLQNEIFYYMATADKDVPFIRNSVLDTHDAIAGIDNQNFTYYFDDFQGDSHYTLVSSAISRAFDKIFDIYQPLREKELQEKVLPFEGTLDKYIVDRYNRIEKLFGIEVPITEEEIEKVMKVAEQREDLESLYKLGKLSQKLYPESPQGTFYLALHADKEGKKKKAAKLYEQALALGDSPMVDKAYIMLLLDETNLATEDLEEEENNEEK
jgi:predicted alpha/beta superfamily hydrolase